MAIDIEYINAVPTKTWRVSVNINTHRTCSRDFDHDPTQSDIESFISSCGCGRTPINVATIWK